MDKLRVTATSVIAIVTTVAAFCLSMEASGLDRSETISVCAIIVAIFGILWATSTLVISFFERSEERAKKEKQEYYENLKKIFYQEDDNNSDKNKDDLHKDYEELKKDYEELKKDYEELKATLNVTEKKA